MYASPQCTIVIRHKLVIRITLFTFQCIKTILCPKLNCSRYAAKEVQYNITKYCLMNISNPWYSRKNGKASLDYCDAHNFQEMTLRWHKEYHYCWIYFESLTHILSLNPHLLQFVPHECFNKLFFGMDLGFHCSEYIEHGLFSPWAWSLHAFITMFCERRCSVGWQAIEKHLGVDNFNDLVYLTISPAMEWKCILKHLWIFEAFLN